MKKNNFINFLIALVIFTGIFSLVRHFYLQPDVASGQKAPDFIALLPDGKAFKLAELKGQYVLLDFWGSWCGPCLQEMPALAKLYEKYHNASFREASNFTIVSIAVEKDRANWLRAIERLGMNWPYQVIDPTSSFKFFNAPIANLYGVRQLPTKFLINEKGLIEGVDMTPGQIDRYLQERM